MRFAWLSRVIVAIGILTPVAVYFTPYRPPWFPGSALVTSVLCALILLPHIRAGRIQPLRGLPRSLRSGRSLVIVAILSYVIYAVAFDWCTVRKGNEMRQIGFGLWEGGMTQSALVEQDRDQRAAMNRGEIWPPWTASDFMERLGGWEPEGVNRIWKSWTVSVTGLLGVLSFAVMFCSINTALIQRVLPAALQRAVFLCYAHADNESSDPQRQWPNRVLHHLKPFRLKSSVVVWSDREIDLADRWRDEIEKSLEHARVAILLVSPAFLDSDFIREKELPALLSRAESDDLKLLPLIVEECDPESRTFLFPDPKSGPNQTTVTEYQYAPTNGALSLMKDTDQEEILERLAQRVFEALSS